MIDYDKFDTVEPDGPRGPVQVFTGPGLDEQIAEYSRAEGVVRHMRNGVYIDTDKAELSDNDVISIIRHWTMPAATEITVDRENMSPLRFQGVHLVTETSNPDREMGVRLHCWRHIDGWLVAAIERWSERKGQRSIWAARVFEDDSGIVDWFAWTPLAKRVYEKLGIDIAEEV